MLGHHVTELHNFISIFRFRIRGSVRIRSVSYPNKAKTFEELAQQRKYLKQLHEKNTFYPF